MQNVLKLTLAIIICLGCHSTGEKKEIANFSSSKIKIQTLGKVLFVVSNQKTYGNTTLKTSNHFGEIVYAYDVLINAGYQVDFVSPKGGEIVFGYLNQSNKTQKKYLNDKKLLNKLKYTFSPNKIDFSNYKAIYYVGGGAAMFGVPENKKIQNLAINIYEKNKGIISAICHGTAGIAHIKNSKGEYVYKGKKVSGYPDSFERTYAEYYKTFPFSIEKIISKRGGDFTYSNKRRANYYKVDGRLITGQDPSASASVAQKIVEILANQQKSNL